MLNFRIDFSSIQNRYANVNLVVIHNKHSLGQTREMTYCTIMGVQRYQTLSENTIDLMERYYWPEFIVNSFILDPALVQTITRDIGLFSQSSFLYCQISQETVISWFRCPKLSVMTLF